MKNFELDDDFKNVVHSYAAIVCDNGTGYVKAGFAGEESPCVVFPSLIGTPKKPKNVMKGMGLKNVYVGKEAERRRGVLKLSYPLEHGIVQDWDDMENLYDHLFYDRLRVDPMEHAILLTEPPLNPKKNREKMGEMMFETYSIPGVYMAIQAVLSLYESGRVTGLVCDVGDGVCHVVPIYEGFALTHAIDRINLAGRDLTNYLMRQLLQLGYSFRTTAEKEIVRRMKENLCYVAMDFQKEVEREKKGEIMKTYELPDGKSVKVGRPCFQTPEAMFQPHLCGLESQGIQNLIWDAIQKCDIDIKVDLGKNVILSGGTTMFDHFADRLQLELKNLAPAGMATKIKVFAPAERKVSVWAGGSILAELPSFTNQLISKAEWEEVGPKLIHIKCF